MMKAFKYLISLILALSIFALTFTATASESDPPQTSGSTGDCVWTLDGTELTISGCGAMADYQWNAPWGDKITKAVITEGVTNIGDSAFRNCTELKSVSIPDSVTTIGDHALDYCVSLESLTIPEKVTSIGYDAFFGCKTLESITVPASVTDISTTAFSTCSGLKSFSVDKDNPVYDSRDNCNALIRTADDALICGTNITVIPDSVVSIGEFAFNICSGLTEITIPDNITEIGDMAFYSCSDLTAVTIGKGLKAIGKQVFYGCSALSSVTLCEGLTEIGTGAFDYCYSLADIKIPNSVTTIRGSAFANCKAMTSVTIPVGVKTIEVAAFYYCTELTTVIIPSSVKTIGDQAFGYYYNNGTRKNTDLVIYGFKGTEAGRYASDNGFAFADPSDAPEGSVIPAADYYLTGSFNDWDRSDKDCLFTLHKTDDGAEEYKLTVSLRASDDLKVIGADGKWYPDGTDNNYHITEGGVYDIYFRPNYDGKSDWFNKVLYVSKKSDIISTEPESEPTEPSTGSPTTDKMILGDADGDGSISILDVTIIQRYLAAYTVNDPERVVRCGDVNGDILDIIDATLIQRYLASYTVNYPIGEAIS